jgi:hypothetical protein
VVLVARTKTEAAESKVATAGGLAGIGASIGAVGGPVGAAIGGGIGAITGLIIGDQTTVFPMDMVAIPAFQAYLLERQPEFMIYIKEGEVLTQVKSTDAEEAEEIVLEGQVGRSPLKATRPRKTAYQIRYKRAFNQIKSRFKKKNGDWKKGGFKAAVKAAHKIAGGKK